MNMLLFALNSSAAFGNKVAAHLQLPLALHEECEFEDGEHKSAPRQEVRGRDVFIIQSLHAGPDTGIDAKLCRLLFFIAAVHDAGAARITAVIPYFAFARQDRRGAPGDQVTLQYVARLLEAASAAQVICMDIHNVAAFQDALRIPADNLQAHDVFADWFARHLRGAQVTVVSPDTGGIPPTAAVTPPDCGPRSFTADRNMRVRPRALRSTRQGLVRAILERHA